VGLAVAGLLAAGAFFMLRSLLEGAAKGELVKKPVGGEWVTETRYSVFQHGGPGSRLFHGRGKARRLVGEIVYSKQYLGQDCMAYNSRNGADGPRCFVACGEREPLPLFPPGYPECEIYTTGVKGAAAEDPRKEAMFLIPTAELLKRGLRQPLRALRAPTGQR
jgi:hypothetical protein